MQYKDFRFSFLVCSRWKLKGGAVRTIFLGKRKPSFVCRAAVWSSSFWLSCSHFGRPVSHRVPGSITGMVSSPWLIRDSWKVLLSNYCWSYRFGAIARPPDRVPKEAEEGALQSGHSHRPWWESTRARETKKKGQGRRRCLRQSHVEAEQNGVCCCCCCLAEEQKRHFWPSSEKESRIKRRGHTRLGLGLRRSLELWKELLLVLNSARKRKCVKNLG